MDTTEAAKHPRENAAPVFPDKRKNDSLLYLRNGHYGVCEDGPSSHIARIHYYKQQASALSHRNSNDDTQLLPLRLE
ncbi:MAG TPA: hypothetical protein PLN34_07650 [Alloprevotella sp.]|nr:hypothetical protein [Alloprevotella sp.]